MGNVRSKEGREDGKEGDGGGIAGFVIPEMIVEILVTIRGFGLLGRIS